MKKLITLVAVGAFALAVPAQAKPPHAGGGAKPKGSEKSKGAERSQGRGGRCKTRSVGYNARGVLVAVDVTQTAGADTPTEAGDDRYSGTVEVDVTKVNHKGAKGVQTFTLTNAKVKHYDADGDGAAEQPKAGDLVKVHGKVTRRHKRCSGEFAPTVTVKQVQFKAAPAPAPAPTG